jgi:NTE family protein
LSRKRVGLALSSGAARGLAHIGVLATLERKGIPIDMIAGTSMGAIVGGAYAAGKSIDQIKESVEGLNLRQMAALADFTIPTSGLIKGKKLTGWLKAVIGGGNFEDLKIPFACVATDINSGEGIVIKQGSVVEAVKASAAIPVIFTPTRYQDRYLVDGGLVDPIPVAVLREMGADFVIAVNVVPYIGDKIPPEEASGLKKPKAPNIFGVLVRLIYIIGYQSALAGLRGADITIAPNVSNIRPDSFNRARECILRGQRAAQRAIPEIKRALES